MYDISHERILAAARRKFGDDVRVSAPYAVDHEVVRVGVEYGFAVVDGEEHGGISHGVNFFYKEGEIR